MIRDMTANPDAMLAALEQGFPTATDLADYMVRELGCLCEAHHASGAIVAAAAAKGVDIALSLAERVRAADPTKYYRPAIGGNGGRTYQLWRHRTR